MGNQLHPLEQCRRQQAFRDPNPTPRAPLCTPGGCERTCGAEARAGGGCDPAGTVFDETTLHLSDTDRLAFKFAGTCNVTALRWLFVYGARAQVADANGTTLLHVACRSGSLQVVQDLVRRGLSVDVADKVGWTPLHVASCMGRQDVSLYLLQQGADPECRTERGQTAQDVCSDARMREVVLGYDTTLRLLPAKGLCALEDTSSGSMRVSGGLHFEPFFVPRDPALREAHVLEEMQSVGVDLFNMSSGHGLAFLVAAGVVADYPVNVNRFLVHVGVDPERYGDFLGSDAPLAHTLRLEFLNSLQLVGTGVVSALRAAFQYVAVPRDWQRLDRFTRGVAHFWWQQHLEERELKKSEGTISLGAEGSRGGGGGGGARSHGGGSSSSTNLHAAEDRELCGLRLQRCVASAEGLYRLMFSTLMLHQWLNAGHQLTLNEWTQLNTSIDDKGSDVPRHVQIGIYDTVSQDRFALCGRPSCRATPSPSLPPLLEGWAQVRYSGRAQVSHEGMPAVWVKQSPQTLAAQGGVSSVGRAAPVASECSEARAAECDGGVPVWRPSSSLRALASHAEQRHLPEEQDASAAGDDGEDRTWVAAHPSIILFSRAPDEPPYAFLSLRQSTFGEVDTIRGRIAFQGRPRQTNPAVADGETSRMLELILLLGDGRFQVLEAPFLELRIPGADFPSWMIYLRAQCSTANDVYRV